MAQRELLQELRGGAIEQWPADALGAPHHLHEAALQQRAKQAPRGDAADVLDLGTPDRLSVGDDGERLERRAREPLRARGEGEEWEDPRAELVRRLLEYQQMREIVDVLERRGDDRRNRFARGYCPDDPTPPPRGPLALALPELFSAIDRVLRISREPVVHEVVARALDVDGAMNTIMNVLSSRAQARWRDVIMADAAPWQVLSALLALLELARRGDLRVYQTSPFASMEIRRDAASEAA
jgi:segregation and condensation protein A